MAETPQEIEAHRIDPLETVELFARRIDMDAQRVDEHELHISLTGSWRDVGIWVAWRAEAQVLQIGAPLEMRVPKERELEVMRLLALVNERLTLGHFDLWEADKGLVYRNGAVLTAGQTMEDSQAEILVRGAMDAFERFYPTFNYVVWGGKTAEEALEASLFETVGSA
ncbi:MAG: YbjN domain-containing protein, partial [Pseudomonadota bacterium]